MTITDDSYGFARSAAWDSYAARLSGCRNGYLLVVCTTPLRSDCAEALQKSFHALGYGTDAVTYLVATDELLQTSELYRAVEAIDPGVILATDDQANALLCQTYGIAAPSQPAARAGGRPFLSLPDMASLMERDKGRQKIWAALKTLPKLS
jgi:hypothetical protein